MSDRCEPPQSARAGLRTAGDGRLVTDRSETLVKNFATGIDASTRGIYSSPMYAIANQEAAMDFTLYLPEEIGQRAKDEQLKLSPMLRKAVIDELDRRDAVSKATTEEPQIYDIEMKTREGKAYIARITGKFIYGDPEAFGIYLKSDNQFVLVTDGEWEPLNEREVHERMRDYLDASHFEDDAMNDYIDACATIGIKPVIDL